MQQHELKSMLVGLGARRINARHPGKYDAKEGEWQDVDTIQRQEKLQPKTEDMTSQLVEEPTDILKAKLNLEEQPSALPSLATTSASSKPVDKKLVTVVDQAEAESGVKEPEYTLEQKVDKTLGPILQLSVVLQGVGSVAEIDLDIADNTVDIEVMHMYRTHIVLPSQIQAEQAQAKFIKSKETLKLKLPCS